MSKFNQTIDSVTAKQVSKGQQSACRRVYEQFSSAVYNLAYRMVQQPQDAQDILQDSFIIAFQRIKQWSQIGKFGFWLRKIVINQSLDCIKQRQREVRLKTEQANRESQQLPNHQATHDVNILLAQLPPLSRSVLWLYEVEGMTHQEIADLHQMSVSFSKSQLQRSKKALRAWLNNQQEQQHEQQQ